MKHSMKMAFWLMLHPAPEPRRHVRVPHGVVDEQVRDGVAECMFAGLEDALERERVSSLVLVNDLRPHVTARIDCPDSRMCRPVRLLSLSKAPTSLHCMTG